jgi:hypothetical protein
MPNLGIGRYIESNSLAGTAILLVGHEVTVVAVRAINTTAALAHIQLFDKATAAEVTPGTTVPTWVVTSQASAASDGDGLPNGGLQFKNGLVAISTTTTTGATGATQHLKVGVI